MNDVTLAEMNQVANLILQKGVSAEQLQRLLKSGLLSDLLGALEPESIDRSRFQALIYASQNAFPAPRIHQGACILKLELDAAEGALDDIANGIYGEKFMQDVRRAHGLSYNQLRKIVFCALYNDHDALRKHVMNYVNMIVGSDALGLDYYHPRKSLHDPVWVFTDPRTGKRQEITINEGYIKSVEARLGLMSRGLIGLFRATIVKMYHSKAVTDTEYDFMDNEPLVRAVVACELKEFGACFPFTHANEETTQIYFRMLETMISKLGLCRTCAEGILKAFCQSLKD